MEKTSELAKGTNTIPESTKASHHPVSPAVDIFESEKEYLIVSDMPGVALDGLTLQFDAPTLFIEGRQPGSAEGQSGVLPISFERSFQMQPSVDADGIKAELKEGVLRVHLAKSEKAKPRRIAVKKG